VCIVWFGLVGGSLSPLVVALVGDTPGFDKAPASIAIVVGGERDVVGFVVRVVGLSKGPFPSVEDYFLFILAILLVLILVLVVRCQINHIVWRAEGQVHDLALFGYTL
jgi:hypothetical protein